MANEVSHRHTATGETLYFTIRNVSRQMWNTAGIPNFETLTVANWGDYDVALTESPASSYFFVGTFPAITGNMVAGWYWVDIFKQAGGSPAISDVLQASYFGYWDGTTFKWWGNDSLALGGDVQSLTDLKDFADAGYDPATNKVQGVVLVDTLTTYTGNTPQTGDAFARLGAPAGVSVSADILTIDNLVDDLESRVGTPSNLGSGATVAANLADIEAQTDDIGIAGAGLTDLGGMSTTMRAQIQTEAEDALVVHRLDELLNADSDIDGLAPPTVGSVFFELLTKTAGSFTYDQTTDSLEALRDRGDAAWVTATGFSTHTAADVWAVATRTLTAGTNIQLPANGLANITAWTVDVTGSLSGSVGSVTSAVTLTSAYDFAKGNVAMTESYRATGGSPTPVQALYEILENIVEFAISGTTKTTKKIDGSTTAKTYTLDSATVPTSITEAT